MYSFDTEHIFLGYSMDHIFDVSDYCWYYMIEMTMIYAICGYEDVDVTFTGVVFSVVDTKKNADVV